MTDFFDHWMNESEENKKLVEKERLKLAIQMKPIPTVEVQVRTVYQLLEESRTYVQATRDFIEWKITEDMVNAEDHKIDLEKADQLLKDIDYFLEAIENDKLSLAYLWT